VRELWGDESHQKLQWNFEHHHNFRNGGTIKPKMKRKIGQGSIQMMDTSQSNNINH
jgi:hypothetical protein